MGNPRPGRGRHQRMGLDERHGTAAPLPGDGDPADITAVALTEVPLTVKSLTNRWRRWNFGVMQVMMDDREIFVRPDKYRGLTLHLCWALYGLTVPTPLLLSTYVMIVITAVDHS